MIFAILPTCKQRKITLKSTNKSNPELSIVVCSKKDKSAINVNLDIQSNLSLYYIFIKPDTPNNFNYSSIQYLQKWTNYTSIIDYISCIVCYVLVDMSMEKRDKKEIAFVNSQSIIDRHNSNFCFFLSNILHHINIMFDSSMQRYLVPVWQTRKKNNYTTDPSTIWSLLSLHTFFKIFNRSFWYVDILNILVQERRATSLSGIPTGFNSSFYYYYFPFFTAWIGSAISPLFFNRSPSNLVGK